jgi:glycosyltransferase involved in cell wall biosynthesis
VTRLAQELPDPGTRVLIVGDGPLRAHVEAAAAANGRLTWLAAVERIEPAITAADVLVLPSRYEGISVVLLEALSLGCPVVATRAGGVDELVRAPGLAIVEADDFAGFREAALADMLARYDALLFPGSLALQN